MHSMYTACILYTLGYIYIYIYHMHIQKYVCIYIYTTFTFSIHPYMCIVLYRCNKGYNCMWCMNLCCSDLKCLPVLVDRKLWTVIALFFSDSSNFFQPLLFMPHHRALFLKLVSELKYCLSLVSGLCLSACQCPLLMSCRFYKEQNTTCLGRL